MEDKKLVQDFLGTRSEAAFLRLYRAKTPYLYQMALRLTQNEYQSEELIQETWVVAVRKLGDFQWKSELKTWLTGILINLFRSKRKAEEKNLVLQASELTEQEAISEAPSDTLKDLEKAIAQLPPGYRQIIILHDIEGYKHKEIASLLDISEGTSKSQLFHARKAIRQFLSEENFKGNDHE